MLLFKASFPRDLSLINSVPSTKRLTKRETFYIANKRDIGTKIQWETINMIRHADDIANYRKRRSQGHNRKVT